MRMMCIVLAGILTFTVNANSLEIHYINVGQGGSTLIVGPNGTTILYDFGKKNGAKSIVPYLEMLPELSDKHIDYSMLSHRDLDHFYGYKGIVDSGYDFIVANYGPGGPQKTGSKLESHWRNIATKTSAGNIRAIPVGLNLSLGDGAELLVVASNGLLFDGSKVAIKNENDRSISLLVRYKNFQYILDGDLGGGAETCSGHVTGQKDVQTPIVKALLKAKLLNKEYGVDVMHVAHHGSESSSPSRYVNKLKPEVGIISVGNPNCSYRHPRENVIKTLRENSCGHHTTINKIYQTDSGSEGCARETDISRTDNSSTVSGDIVIKTNGQEKYTIFTTGILWKNNKRTQVNAPSEKQFYLDEISSQRIIPQ